MKISTTRTARFSEVVKKVGQPESVDLWTKPEQNKRFMQAVKQDRLMSIKQEPVGTAKDFGVVGFLKEKSVTYLIFPKALTPFRDKKIVGIKYELVNTSPALGRAVEPTSDLPQSKHFPQARRASTSIRRKPETKPLPGKEFTVLIRFTATLDVAEKVIANSKRSARQNAERNVRTPDFTGATITRKVVKISEN